MRKILFLLAMVIMAVACGKSDDGQSGGTYTVKVLKSEGVTLLNVVIVRDGQSNTEEVNKPLAEDWMKTFTVKSVIAASVTAKGTNENSTLTLQLLKGDKVVKESTSKGVYLVATVSE
ncbi:hypothetical protein [Capnocytophaga stomatis]|uniref:hypothetical protein n=1 Tax=Capnocytophaga stomatis TaxID=1848904 RepID=UPI001BB438A3|nr:hypothetical protein [Capnocytophaga stomatis]